MSDIQTVSPLDAEITITVFQNVQAKDKDAQRTTLRAFAEPLRDTRAPTREALPLVSFASYGSKRTAKRSLKHDNNLVEMPCVVGDCDTGKLSPRDAVVALETANLCGVVATTSSHTPEEPRIRIILPAADPLNRARANRNGFELAEYGKLVGRLAGLFAPGVVAAESWNRSQGWYIGCPDSAPDHQVHLVETGLCIDQLSYLDQNARPRPSTPTKLRKPRGTRARRMEPIPVDTVTVTGDDIVDLATQIQFPEELAGVDVQACLTAISEGRGSHDALIRLVGLLVGQGMTASAIVDVARFAADQRVAERRDTGWTKMRDRIPSMVAWAIDKEAVTTTATNTAPMTALATIPLSPGSNGASPPPPPPPPPPPGGSAGPSPQPQPQPQPAPQHTGGARALMRNRASKFASNVSNVVTALLERPELIGTVGYDQMALAVSARRPLPGNTGPFEPHPWTDNDTTWTQDFLQRVCLMGRVGREHVQQGVETVARMNPFHPVRDYLDSLAWDGVPRISTWLTDFLEVPDSAYACGIGRMWLIGMVARIRKPGSKLDYMPVLEGPQGTFKSSTGNALCSPWTSDQALDIKSDPRAASQHLRGVWLVEISELTLFKRPEGVEMLKAFLARRHEKYLPRYGHNEVVEPRQCGFIGTTNQSNYLHDATGNRRIWPVVTGNIRLRALMRARDQLWAEADQAYQAGEPWWPSREFEAQVIGPEQKDRYFDDAWLEPIGQELARLQTVAARARANGKPDERAQVTLLGVWQAAMAEPGMIATADATKLKFDRSAQIRVREALQFLGWRRGPQARLARWWIEPA